MIKKNEAREWLLDNAWRFFNEEDDEMNEDALFAALCEHIGVDPDDQDASDEVAVIVNSYVEDHY